MNIKVRFAPSPTGHVHIGNIRTAIFNWLFARHSGGKFLLRVEDTDKERSTRDAIKKLHECMSWLGLGHDEEIYYQSEHEAEHKAIAEKLIKEGKAYHKKSPGEEQGPIIFRIPWELEKCSNVRVVGSEGCGIHPDVPVEIDYSGIKFAQISKKGKPVEFAGCLAGFKNLKIFDKNDSLVFELDKNIEDILSREKSYKFEDCAKISFLRHEVFYNDIIKGELAKPLDTIKDLIILRSDGSPVFHLANVYDDAKQGITHIIRGDDHVENTYRHILLFGALGFDIPDYGHLPMIVNKAGKPYSKRDGDAFVGDFCSKGFLAEALFNYLSLLGWSPGDDREKMSREELLEAFTLERIKSSPAQFDINKLLNMNGLYMAELPPTDFFKSAYDEAVKQGWGAQATDCGLPSSLIELCRPRQESEPAVDYFEKVAELQHSRTKLFSQVEGWKYFFFDDSPLFFGDEDHSVDLAAPMFGYDIKSLRKVLNREGVKEGLAILSEKFLGLARFDSCSIEDVIHEVESEMGIDTGKLNPGLRIALTGKTSGAELYEIIELLGKERAIIRLKAVIKFGV